MCLTEFEDTKGIVIVKGLLIPADWDEGGEIIAVAISTYYEEEYLIERNPKGEELFAFVRQNARISGLVKTDDRGKKIIRVQEYNILEE